MTYRPRLSFEGSADVPRQRPLVVLYGSLASAGNTIVPGYLINQSLKSRWDVVNGFRSNWGITHSATAYKGGDLAAYEAIPRLRKVLCIIDTTDISAQPAAVNAWQDIVQAATAKGWSVIASTPIVLNNVWITNSTYIPWFTGMRDTIKNNAVPTWGAAGLVDFAADPGFNVDPATSAYFTSGSLNASGYQHIADLTTPIIDALYVAP